MPDTVQIIRASPQIPTTHLQCPLFMDCTEEHLSESQRAALRLQDLKFQTQFKRLEKLIEESEARIKHSEADRLIAVQILGGQKRNSDYDILEKRKPSPEKNPIVNNEKKTQIDDDIEVENPAVMRQIHMKSSNLDNDPNSMHLLRSNRVQLDAMVKQVLVITPAKFTEWLIKRGLLFKHREGLQLGMHSAARKFPLSGGYVWLNGAADKFVSVFEGSIFEQGIKPFDTLKLIYHWSCQTNVSNVSQWVKVEWAMIYSFYSKLRAIASLSVQEEVVNLPGPIEIAVIEFGKHKVLAALDLPSKKIRFSSNGKNLSWLQMCLNAEADIYTSDESVESLKSLGFSNVYRGKCGNVLEYLTRSLPEALKDESHIQGYLDELTFRECFGSNPLLCFEAILKRIEIQTQSCSAKNEALLDRCAMMAKSPGLS